jgi:predicted alpha/beta-fold hydrolase
VVERVIEQHPDSPILLIGFSLGGNVLLKYLGEQGDALPVNVRAAVAVSAPVDLRQSAHALESGFSRIYSRRLTQSLKRKTEEKLARFPGLVDPDRLREIETLTQFDELVTGPVHGFRDAEDYWERSSSAPFLGRIRRPTLLINAKDDPFLPASALPLQAVEENPQLEADFPDAGGHLGFLEGRWPGAAEAWAEGRAADFLAQHTAEFSSPPHG